MLARFRDATAQTLGNPDIIAKLGTHLGAYCKAVVLCALEALKQVLELGKAPFRWKLKRPGKLFGGVGNVRSEGRHPLDLSNS